MPFQYLENRAIEHSDARFSRRTFHEQQIIRISGISRLAQPGIWFLNGTAFKQTFSFQK